MAEKEKEGVLKNVGREFFKKGLPKIGGALVKVAGAAASKTPVGAVLDEIGVFDAVAEALGFDSTEEKAIEDKVKGMTAEELQSLTKLKQLEADLAVKEIERLNVINQEETKRIEAVNETMRAEVLGNPKAGEWRPLWGRWTCYNFFPCVYLLLGLFGYAVFKGNFEIIALFPTIVGAFAALFGLPAAILGVASWKRGQEKIELAKNGKDDESDPTKE